MLFKDVYFNYLLYVEKRHKKQSFFTIKYDFEKYILPFFKDFIISDIKSINIVAWKNYILDFNFSNNYNSKLLYTLSSFIRYCVEFDLLDYSIINCIKPFPKKVEFHPHQVYSFSQFLKFRFFIKDYVIKQYFNFMFFYGTRPSEAMALRFCDVKGKYIAILHNLERHGSRELMTPKNQSSLRAFKLNYFTRFRFYLLKRYYINKYGYFNSNFYIFGGIRPLAPTSIDRIKKVAYTRAKLPKITQHEFRHSFATRMIHSKKSIDFVSKLMGHSKVSTTLDFYLHNEKNTLDVFFNR